MYGILIFQEESNSRREYFKMKFKKIMAVTLAAASLGTMAVTASAACVVDYNTWAITWTFDEEAKNPDVGKTWYEYQDDLVKIDGADSDDKAIKSTSVTSKDLVIYTNVTSSHMDAITIGGGNAKSTYKNNMKVMYLPPADGKVTVTAMGGKKYDTDCSDTKDCKKGETVEFSKSTNYWQVTAVTFTPDKATQYYTFNTTDQSGAVFSKLSLTNTMYGDTAKASLDLDTVVTGGINVVGAIENVPASAELKVTME